METYQIAQVVGLYGAVAASLIISVRASRQAKALQEKQFKKEEEARQREQRQMLLNEIMEWALDLTSCNDTEPVKEILKVSDYIRTDSAWMNYLLADILDTKIAFAQRSAMTLYITKIAPRLASERLSKCVEEVGDYLEAHISSIEEWGKTVPSAENAAKFDMGAYIEGGSKAVESVRQLGRSIGYVIEEVARLKTLEVTLGKPNP